MPVILDDPFGVLHDNTTEIEAVGSHCYEIHMQLDGSLLAEPQFIPMDERITFDSNSTLYLYIGTILKYTYVLGARSANKRRVFIIHVIADEENEETRREAITKANCARRKFLDKHLNLGYEHIVSELMHRIFNKEGKKI